MFSSNTFTHTTDIFNLKSAPLMFVGNRSRDGYNRSRLSISRLSLARVLDRNSFRANANHSEPIRKTFCNAFDKNGKKSIRPNPKQQPEWIRTNPKPSFQSESIRARIYPNRIFNQNQSELNIEIEQEFIFGKNRFYFSMYSPFSSTQRVQRPFKFSMPSK